MLFTRAGCALLLMCALVVCGCGPGDVARTNVTGKVTYKGNPLPAGTVAFINGSTVATGEIKDGQYSIPNVAVGENKISVTTPPPPSQGQQMQMKQKVEGKSFSGEAPTSVAIPAKYNNPDSSGLTYTVTAEKTQTNDIELKD